MARKLWLLAVFGLWACDDGGGAEAPADQGVTVDAAVNPDAATEPDPDMGDTPDPDAGENPEPDAGGEALPPARPVTATTTALRRADSEASAPSASA